MTPNTSGLQQGHGYRVEDGKLKFFCAVCEKPAELSPEATDKNFKYQTLNPHFDFTCTDCYKQRGKDEDEWERKRLGADSKDERISYAQSWNLAVASLPEGVKNNGRFEEVVEERQRYFYYKLTNRS